MNYPLRLEAVTIRGIGSYVDGARLEIRPITVLCGTNGSGKSTWFKVLRLVQASLATLPWEFDFDGSDLGSDEWMNARVRTQDAGTVESDDQISRFGPLGTVGLEFVTVEPLNPATSDAAGIGMMATSPPQRMLWRGECEAGMRLRIRISHPTHIADTFSPEGFQHLIELRIGDEHLIRLSAPSPVFDGDTYPVTVYSVECSKSLLPGQSNFVTSMVELARIEYRRKGDWSVLPVANGIALDVPELVCKNALARICELLKLWASAYFHIGAVRDVPKERGLDFTFAELPKEVPDVVSKRRVGSDGHDTLLLERFFSFNDMRKLTSAASLPMESTAIGPTSGPVFDTFVSKWMKRLTGVEVTNPHGRFHPSDHWSSSAESPRGFLEYYEPRQGRSVPPNPDDDPTDLARFQHGCTGWSHTAKRLSSGFQQVLPIVVQVFLMKPGEMLSIENPEVHLHPKLQLEVTEFLFQQADDGRFILIETHSDLIIRRLLRAVLGEEFAQEKLRIYFTHLRDRPYGYLESQIEPLRVDDRGHFANWPAGFLDTSIGESRRLGDLMYPPPSETEE